MNPKEAAHVQPSHSGIAPYYLVPRSHLVCVEHPFEIRSCAKAVQSLGGPRSLEKAVSENYIRKHELALYLHPEKHGFNSILSGNMPTNNVLCQITVPKLTGRKRKRGSSDPFEKPTVFQHAKQPAPSKTSGEGPREVLLRSLRDNPENYDLRVIGSIERTHRFRTMPDFVWSLQSNAFMNRVESHIEPLSYRAAKGFSLKPDRGVQKGADLVPPPVFSDQILPFNYSYRQNPNVKQRVDASGKTISYNESRVEKHRTLRIASNYSNVPSKPPDNLVPFEYWHDGMQRLIRKVQELFEMRPVWTRRAVINHVQNFPSLGDIKYVFAYVGYEFLSGPWSNTIVKYGIDPRQDPKYRVYQSMTFHVAEEPRVPSLGAKEHKRGGARTKRSPGSASEQSQHATSHLFDGEGIDIQDGRSWQVCDITDPILKALLATGMLRSDCHLKTDGWYQNGTWAKARAIFKYKIRAILMEGTGLTQSDFAQVAALPEIFNVATSHLFLLKKSEAPSNVVFLAQQVRSMVSDKSKAQVEESDLERDDRDEAARIAEDRTSGYDSTREMDLQALSDAGDSEDGVSFDLEEENE